MPPCKSFIKFSPRESVPGTIFENNSGGEAIANIVVTDKEKKRISILKYLFWTGNLECQKLEKITHCADQACLSLSKSG